jgi:predicted ATPase
VDHLEYDGTIRQVAALVDAASYDEAIALLQGLLDSDLPDLDKSMMCVNMAVAHERKGQVEQALAWYDRGIACEAAYLRFFVVEHKAAFLHGLRRYAESLALYEGLSGLPFATSADRQRFGANIATIRKDMG